MKISESQVVEKEARDMMPEFFNRIDKGELHLYDGSGFTRELSDEMKKKVEEMEKEWKVKVVAVVEGEYVFPGEDAVHMVAYVYGEEKEDLCWIIDDTSVGFMANVVNDSWDIEEAGSVGLTERTGRVLRTM